jgi:hypothetical protein
MCVNTADTLPFTLPDNIVISHAERYTYLGNIITIDSVAKQVMCNLEFKERQLHKYCSFLRKNSDAPYWIKHKVLQSALNSSIFYGCESWITSDLAAANRVHTMALKQLLGVRAQTCNLAVHVESGNADAKAIILKRQKTFLTSCMARDTFNGSPLDKTINIARNMKSPAFTQLCKILDLQQCPVETYLQSARTQIQAATTTKLSTYRTINPALEVHPIYYKNSPVEEYKRIETTRLRLSSHRLKIETGRWSRIQRDQRLCSCGAIQDESHVLLACPRSQNLRNASDMACTTVGELMSKDPQLLCAYIYKVLQLY